MTFSQRLEALRKEHRMSQQDIGDIMGVSQTMVSNYEKNDAEPGIGHVIKLSKHFKKPLSYFYPDIGDVMPKESTADMGTRIVDHLLTENENLWEEQRKSTEERLQLNSERQEMFSVIKHFILKNAV